jgi:TolB-like protein/Tfp pilus assembly protein PilF
MPGFWGEVRRRHVLRVAAYYVAAAWVLAQAGALLLDAFDAGHYTRFLIAALVVGLPIALALAWIFDITPHGIQRTLALARAPELVTDPAAVAQASPPPDDSIAVLPFDNLSRDPANEYFSDGLAEEIRNQLARVAGLRVAARTSSFAFKARHEDVREIGRRLNVAALLEGGVRKEADVVRIDVRLVSASDGFQLWSDSFERRLDDIFKLQTEISCAVIAAVRGRQGMPAAEAAPPAAPAPGDFEAYNAYLRGRHQFHQRTEASLTRAVGHFQRAIELDPQYSPAYAGLADTWMLLGERYYGNLSVPDSVGRALTAVTTALSLTPDLAEAHASLGLIRLNQDDIAGARQSLERAVALNQGYTLAHVWLGLVLLAQGHYREAAARNLQAYRLDPLSPIVVSNAAFDALRAGDDELARSRFSAAIEIEPRFPVPYSGMSRLNAVRGRIREAIEWIDRAIDIAPERAFYRARRGLLELQLGNVEEAAQCIRSAQERAPDNVFDSELVLAMYMAQRDRARLEDVATGKAGRAFTVCQRAYAWVVLGDHAQALATYELAPTTARAEVGQVLNDDWVWRLPHSVTRAHLRRLAGEQARADEELRAFIAAADSLIGPEVWNGDVLYWAATAYALLGDLEKAVATLRSAVDGGWRHAWWARLDWNLDEHRHDPRIVALLERASP